MPKEVKRAGKKDNSSSNLPKYILFVVLAIPAGYFIYDSVIKKEETVNKQGIVDPKERIKNVKEPVFKREGELEFISVAGKTSIKKIEVEIADNDNERSQGLMYRKSMDESRGMLFIFPREQVESFWMKNTIMPLDIIYVNSKKEIVKIFKSTTPFSEISLPSEKPAQYVVEVAAGFTDKYGIKEGDQIRFEK